MILFVPSLILALIVLAWIAWIAFGPRSTANPPLPFLTDVDSKVSRDDGDSTGAVESDTLSGRDYQRHIRNRIEEHSLPLGSAIGAAIPMGSFSAHREPDSDKGSLS